jgi:hypothetical protein
VADTNPGAADTPTAIEQTTPNQDPADRPHGWQWLDALPLEFVVDGTSPEFTQRTGVPELLTQTDHQILDSGCRRVLLTPPAAWMVRPINTRETLVTRSADPYLHGPQADPEPLRHRPHRSTPSYSCHNGLSFILLGVLFFVFDSWLRSRFGVFHKLSDYL